MNFPEKKDTEAPAPNIVWLPSSRTLPSSGVPLPCSDCDAERPCQVPTIAAGHLVSALGSQIGMRVVRVGKAIYRAGDVFRNLYVPRCGICKCVRLDRDGRQQITGFKIAGECFGMDGIAGGIHQLEAVALIDMQVCIIPFSGIELAAGNLPDVHRDMERMLSMELMATESLLMLVAQCNAQQRVAGFLLDLATRYGRRTSRPDRFPLCISREDIGAYLGLTLETVSRVFSRLKKQNLINWEGRVMHLLDMQRLAAL
ncbi:transcriptional regulatory protein [Bordetella ansorpii]|uniref:Transcriptional regulatory protein n=1 Tax=Bordetella ansorpii TaxID=288768 RepID=A0A157SJB7_9BORD|nr:helix-turn-helix domain-containing protein [Bordetella ansorpii]SAI70497.1 transcriptional regulatory protein [Bordetella ansorpii]